MGLHLEGLGLKARKYLDLQDFSAITGSTGIKPQGKRLCQFSVGELKEKFCSVSAAFLNHNAASRSDDQVSRLLLREYAKAPP